ncbi:MAG: hypothetical protein QOF51_1415, partial [Chloroflexota bacterium]|nr:hypothetical protein [Chloroflexota bacterium]
PIDAIYVVQRSDARCCTAARAALEANPRFTLTYDGPGAAIFTRR